LYIIFYQNATPNICKIQFIELLGGCTNHAFPLGGDFPVSGENVCEADKRGTGGGTKCRMRGAFSKKMLCDSTKYNFMPLSVATPHQSA